MRINNASREEKYWARRETPDGGREHYWNSRDAEWEGSFVDVPLPRNIQP